jgi:hypothetical protein
MLGPQNAGKSTVLEALDLLLHHGIGRPRPAPTEIDYFGRDSPAGFLVGALVALGQPGWTFAAKVTLTQTTARLVREALRAQGVEAAIRAAVGDKSPKHATVPLLVGVAVVTAVEANIGKAAADALLELQKREAIETRAEAQRERQRSAPAAAEAEAARPTLTPMPADAFGEAAR